ncbi:MarR family transcriptional regulator [Lactobacillus sp. ESL0236]|nr:MarR family transcriptional regulator [Lactobacillus sp. ESL0237]RMC42951.1 MarR family transcriptional regulator [Lactobacillus sp. ESL0234]RMC43805.1 MarR family transcriptional regulator [Lactobacillus sp. ESL0236]
MYSKLHICEVKMKKEIGSKIKVANTLIERELNNQMSSIFGNYRLTGVQSMILVVLYEADNEPIIQKELADKFVLSHPTIRSVVRRLENAGLVQTGFLASDHRQVTLNLTLKGRDLMRAKIDKIYAVMNEVNHKISTHLTESESNKLVNILDVIINNLK